MDQEQYDFFAPIIRRIANKEAGTVMDPDDLEQELWVVLVEHFGHDVDYRNEYLVTVLGKQARKITQKERVAYMHFHGAFLYNPRAVKILLEEAVWNELEDSFDLEGRLDLTFALKQLSLREQRMLFMHYGAGEKYTSGTDKSTISRAVDKIADYLNGQLEYSRTDVYDQSYYV